MGERRPEPFALAVGALRERLLRGHYRPEDRLAATELAGELRLSATPVREALCRLAGEGLLEDRRGLGFFVRRLGRRDIAALYRLSLAHLLIALDAVGAGEAEVMAVGSPVALTEQLFATWVAAAGAGALVQSFGRLQAQLGPVRRYEGLVLEDLEGEAEALRQLSDPRARPPMLRRFHARRVRVADRLADLLERGVRPPVE